MKSNILLVIALGIVVYGFMRARDRSYDNPVEPYRRTLLELEQFQAEYRIENGTWSNAPRVEGFRAAERYITVSHRREDNGWAAVVARRGQRGWGCVYYTSGYSEPPTTPGGKSAGPRQVVCDDGPPPGSPLNGD